MEELCTLPFLLLQLVVWIVEVIYGARHPQQLWHGRRYPSGYPRQFQLLVKVEGNDWITVPPEAKSRITYDIRVTVSQACNILKAEDRWDVTSKIRFTPGENGQELIVGYQENRPARRILLKEHKTVEISADCIGSASEKHT